MLAAATAAVAYAGGPYVPQVIVPVEADTTLSVSQSTEVEAALTSNPKDETSPFYGTSSEQPKAVVKDGQGTLVIDKDITTYNPLVVREGTLTIQDATVKNYNKLDNGVCNISVGGNNAHLVLDNASYIQSINYAANYAGSMSIGSVDGKGSVTLTNGSTLHTDHFLFAGYSTTNGHTNASQATADSNTLYTAGEAGRSTINVESGSSLSFSRSQFNNVDVNITGEGSVMRDNARTDGYNAVSWCYYGISSGSNAVKTVINISDGGSFVSNHYNVFGYYDNNSAEINVSGKSNNGVASSINLAQYTYIGYNGNCTMNLTEGAEANINGIGISTLSKVNVGIGSSINKVEGIAEGWISVDGGELENSGTISAYTQLNSGTLTMNEGATSAYLQALGGTLEITGDVTFTGDAELSNVDFIFANGVEIDLSGCDFTFTGGSITITLPDAVAMAYAAEADASQFGLVFKNAGTVSGLVGQEVTVQDAAGNTTTYTLTQDDVVVQAVPEPATATLSLLALAALAARRRRA